MGNPQNHQNPELSISAVVQSCRRDPDTKPQTPNPDACPLQASHLPREAHDPSATASGLKRNRSPTRVCTSNPPRTPKTLDPDSGHVPVLQGPSLPAHGARGFEGGGRREGGGGEGGKEGGFKGLGFSWGGEDAMQSLNIPTFNRISVQSL